MVEPHIEGSVKLCPFWHTPYCSETELRQVQKMYAIIETGGKQYRVTDGDVIYVEKLEAEENSEVVFDKVVAISDGELKIGAPYVEGATVSAKVVKNGKDKKIMIIKHKAKKGYRKRQGHRQPYTQVIIEKINA